MDTLINDSGIRVKFVVSKYNINKGKKDKWYNMVSTFAKKHNICVYSQNLFKNNDEKLINIIEQEKVDLIGSCAYPLLIKKEIIEFINKKGIVNFHGSLLPKYRGLSPVIWALINDDDYIGITLCYKMKILILEI